MSEAGTSDTLLGSVVRAQGAALKDKDAEIAIALATITQLKE